jgi:UPF0271 protein
VNVEIERFGDAALRIRLANDLNPRSLLAALRAHPGVTDAVVTERHALVTFDPAAPPLHLESVIAAALTATPLEPPPEEHVAHVRYDGADIDEIARTLGGTRRDVARIHAAGRYVVAVIGFLPGFAYLRGLDPRLEIPRRKTPRPRVGALSVAVAGPYTGVYPFASPGGWNLVGTAVDFTPFDVRKGASLALGDRVTFVEVP